MLRNDWCSHLPPPNLVQNVEQLWIRGTGRSVWNSATKKQFNQPTPRVHLLFPALWMYHMFNEDKRRYNSLWLISGTLTLVIWLERRSHHILRGAHTYKTTFPLTRGWCYELLPESRRLLLALASITLTALGAAGRTLASKVRLTRSWHSSHQHASKRRLHPWNPDGGCWSWRQLTRPPLNAKF